MADSQNSSCRFISEFLWFSRLLWCFWPEILHKYAFFVGCDECDFAADRYCPVRSTLDGEAHFGSQETGKDIYSCPAKTSDMTFVPMHHGRKLVCLLIAMCFMVGFVVAAPPTILITSSPSGAEVYIGGIYKGDTPLDLTGSYSVGSYAIELKKDGYVSWLGTLVVKNGETTSISATLIPYKGNADISSMPTGATIYLDGNYVGVSHQVINDIPTGIHAISLKKDGYYDWNSEIEIVKGKTIAITAEMETREIPYDGSINILSTPSNAEVYIDGELKGYTPLIIRELGPGNYHINLKLAGYQDWDVSVDVSADEQEKISANLYPSASTSPSETSTPISPLISVISIGIVGLALYCTQKKIFN